MSSESPGRVIAIGDVHGCSAALRTLLDVIEPQSNDTIIMLGDCVDRGPDSAGVIDRLLNLRDQCQLVPLLGNHEELMLNFFDGIPQPDDWLQVGGAETMASYKTGETQHSFPREHEEFIRTWGDCYETDTHFFVHGCYEPDRPLAKQHWQTMRWQSLKHGIPEPHQSGKIAIVGHSSQKKGEILNVGHLLCIDTFCFGGGWLTAMDANTGKVWQADREGRLRRR